MNHQDVSGIACAAAPRKPAPEYALLAALVQQSKGVHDVRPCNRHAEAQPPSAGGADGCNWHPVCISGDGLADSLQEGEKLLAGAALTPVDPQCSAAALIRDDEAHDFTRCLKAVTASFPRAK